MVMPISGSSVNTIAIFWRGLDSLLRMLSWSGQNSKTVSITGTEKQNINTISSSEN